MKIYSLYSLYEKNNPEKIKFIGITSQTLSKRISDIIACSKLETAKGFNSRLSLWSRELSARQERPAGKIHFEHSDLTLVKIQFANLMRSVDMEELLNAFLLKDSILVNLAKKPHQESAHALKNFQTKQFIAENSELSPSELQSLRMKLSWQQRKA